MIEIEFFFKHFYSFSTIVIRIQFDIAYQESCDSEQTDVFRPFVGFVEFDASGAAGLRNVESLSFVPLGLDLPGRLVAPNHQIHQRV